MRHRPLISTIARRCIIIITDRPRAITSTSPITVMTAAIIISIAAMVTIAGMATDNTPDLINLRLA